MLQPDLSYDPMATDDLVTQFITDCRRRGLTLATQAGLPVGPRPVDQRVSGPAADALGTCARS